MNRTKYLNKYRNNKYDRLEILLPQGQKKTLSDLCSSLNISINEYIRTLIASDISGNQSVIFTKQDTSCNVDLSLLEKWQIPKKYRPMIEDASYSKETGYFIKLKDGYINDASNTRVIHVNKLDELRLTINKSHKI